MAFVTLQGQAASAQLLWDWGGEQTIGGSGRQVVSFDRKYSPGQIIVSFGDRRLYLITQPGQAISYPIAVPREKSRWEGVTTVTQKRINPSWTPTPTMIAENPRLPRWVPGGHPYNPLGVRALYLGSSAYRIHGTDAPWTIGTAASKGCIRLYNQDVLDLYPRVPVGAKVTVTYQTFTTTGAVSNVVSKGLSLFGPSSDEEPAEAAPPAKRAPRAKAKSGKTVRASAQAAVDHSAAAPPAATPVAETTGASAPRQPEE